MLRLRSRTFSWALFILCLLEAVFWNSISCEAVFSGLGPEYQQEAKEYINRETGLVKSAGTYLDPENMESPEDQVVEDEETKSQKVALKTETAIQDNSKIQIRREKQKDKRRKLIATRKFVRALTTFIPRGKTKEHENPSQGKMFLLVSDWEGTVWGGTHSFLQKSFNNIVNVGKSAINFVFVSSQLS